MLNFEFLLNPELWEQYLVMILGTAFLGGALRLAYGMNRIRSLRVRLSKLDKDLAMWQKQLHDTRQIAAFDHSRDISDTE